MARLHQALLLSSSGMEFQRIKSSESSHRLLLAFGESGSGGSRPGLSFPLGTGLVVLIILFVSAVFSFCYHWVSLKKSRTAPPATSTSVHGLQPTAAQQAGPPTHEAAGKPVMTKLDLVSCPPVVYIAGEYIPRFIAVPCPFVDPSLSTGAAEDMDAALRKALSFEPLKLDIRPENLS